MSDSEESDIVPIKRRKKYNIEDSESFSSCDSSPVLRKPAKRLKRHISESSSDGDSDEPIIYSKRGPKIIESDSEQSSSESEWQSDWSSDNTEVLIQKTLLDDVKNNSENTNSQNAFSSSDDENSEKCPICLLKLSRQEVATPENCAHSFCFECLQEWSKNVSTCPIDRKEFSIMLVRSRYTSSHKWEVEVVKNKKPDEEEIEDTTYCEICRNSDREDTMLLCDGCDCGFHMDCLTPILVEVPAGDWFCSSCSESNTSLNENTTETRNRTHHNTDRLIPRTIHSERVRQIVESQRGRTRQFTLIDMFDPDQPSTSTGFVSNELFPRTASPKKTVRKRKTTTTKKRTTKKRRRKVTRRRKYTTEYEICQETGAKILVKKLVPSKRGTRKSGKRKVKRKVKGKSRKRKSKSSPYKKNKSVTKLSEKDDSEVVQSSASTLHLFGRRNELDYFSDDSDIEQPTSSSLSAIAKLNLNKSVPKKREIIPATSSSNFLDSILESQEKWHSKKNHFQMRSDGKLVIKN